LVIAVVEPFASCSLTRRRTSEAGTKQTVARLHYRVTESSSHVETQVSKFNLRIWSAGTGLQMAGDRWHLRDHVPFGNIAELRSRMGKQIDYELPCRHSLSQNAFSAITDYRPRSPAASPDRGLVFGRCASVPSRSVSGVRHGFECQPEAASRRQSLRSGGTCQCAP